MRKLLIGALLLSIMPLSAQMVTIVKTDRLPVEKASFPVFSNDGSYLAFSSASHEGLAVYDFKDHSVIQVTNESGAGYDPVFSEDNKKVFYRNTVLKSRLRYDGIKSFDLEKKETREVIEPQRNLKLAQSFENGFMVVNDNKLVKATYGKSASQTTPYVWSDSRNLNLYSNGKHQVLNPVEDAGGYIWASLSPDEDKIVFCAVGKGTYVCDLQGNILASLGFVNAPVWFGNEYVVGMQDKDDGHVITDSKIIIKSLDGKLTEILSPSEQIALEPTASAQAGKVAYATLEGDIYVLELSINY